MPTPLPYRAHYHRHLPHYQPPEATLFVTFRLHGSLPVETAERLKDEATEREKKIERLSTATERRASLYAERKRQFGRFDDALDTTTYGPTWLKNRWENLRTRLLHDHVKPRSYGICAAEGRNGHMLWVIPDHAVIEAADGVAGQ